MVLLLLASFVLAAQKQSRNYKVMRNGSEIGWLSLEKLTDSNTTTISMGSEIKARFFFTFSSAAKEISQFREGKLHHSYFYRKMNGNVKADRHTRLVGNSYEVEDKSEKTKLHIPPVTFNTLCMYFQEPVDRKQVYSDNHQCFLDIEKESDGAYKISFPDATSNSFYYTRGVCYKVKIDHSFYSAALMLK
ncbi:MAG: DUF6134 family protein [Bacteroidota bacterium]